MTEAVGWAGSALLVGTICSQLARQWRTGESAGVSRWLYIGQTAASALFLAYSWLIGDTVFVATNALMLGAAAVGLALTFHHRRCAATRDSALTPPPR